MSNFLRFANDSRFANYLIRNAFVICELLRFANHVNLQTIRDLRTTRYMVEIWRNMVEIGGNRWKSTRYGLGHHVVIYGGNRRK
jgi:hypothetical protein